MAPRAGLHRLAELSAAAIQLGRTAPGRFAGRMLAAAFVAFLAVRLWQLWRRDAVDLSHLDAGIAVLAVAVSVLSVASYGIVWLYVLRRLRAPAPARWITLFFKSQLGKYIPGSVWQYAGRAGLGRRYGLPLGTALASIAVEVVASSFAAGVVGLLVLTAAEAGIAVVAIAGIAALVIVLRRRLLSSASRVAVGLLRLRVNRDLLLAGLRAVPWAVPLYALVWVAYGLAFWLTARALFDVPATQLPFYVGTFALAWLAGFVAVFAPGGVGVREAVIVALLRSRLGEANAIVLAASSRLILTGIDLAAGGLSMGLPLLQSKGKDPDPLPGAPR